MGGDQTNMTLDEDIGSKNITTHNRYFTDTGSIAGAKVGLMVVAMNKREVDEFAEGFDIIGIFQNMMGCGNDPVTVLWRDISKRAEMFTYEEIYAQQMR